MRVRTSVGAGIAAFAMLGVAATPAQAVHWPYFGGDNGRSGNQPVDEGGVPLSAALVEKKGTEEDLVRTSIVTSTGAPAAQRLAFGTFDTANGGSVHLQLLASGDPVGPEAGIDIDEGTTDADVFGVAGSAGSPLDSATRGTSLSFSDTSSAAGLGQLFVVHNDDDTAEGAADIEIAQVDEASGALVTQADIVGTDGFTVDSSSVTTGPDGSGGRALFFTARAGTGGTAMTKLFKVPVTSASSVTAGIGAATSVDALATPGTSPVLLTLPVAGTPTAHVAVGTTDERVKTYKVSDLTPGPMSPALGGVAQTPSVPVQPNGLTPGEGQPVATAPAIYVATLVPGLLPPIDTDATVVQRLSGADLTIQNTSDLLDGAPASALAISQKSETTLAQGKVVLTTGTNVHVLDTAAMETGAVSSAAGTPGTTGYLQTTAAVSGGFIYVTTDNGTQRVLKLADAQPVTAAEFTRDPDATTATFGAFGQPSISRGFVQFAGPAGVFVHRNADAIDPTVAMAAPEAGATVSGPVTVAAAAFDARGIQKVDFRLAGQVFATVTAPASGSSFGAPGARYETPLDTTRVPNGTYALDAVATDGGGRTTTAAARNVTVANPTPPPSTTTTTTTTPTTTTTGPTVTFTAPASGATVRGSTTVAATAADSSPITSVTFTVGSRTICTDTTAPYSCVFRPTGGEVGSRTLTATVRAGTRSATATRRVLVARFTPTSVISRVTPTLDRTRPHRFVTRGTVRRPSTVTTAQGCRRGRVAVTFKVGTRTISTRRTTLSSNCNFRVTTTFRDASRFGRSGRLRVLVRFLGSSGLAPRSATVRTVRTR